jgi:hypothetical protein
MEASPGAAWTPAVKPYQRVTRPGLGELDDPASGIVPSSPGRLGSDAKAVWEAAEARRAALPEKLRSALGIFYTPPAVAERLLDDLAEAGARFDGTMRFCDPACGGGAFLLPVARRIADRLGAQGSSASDLASCLIGLDIDQGGLAITRAALDALAWNRFGETARWDLRRKNTLRLAVDGRLPAADVVVGPGGLVVDGLGWLGVRWLTLGALGVLVAIVVALALPNAARRRDQAAQAVKVTQQAELTAAEQAV